MKCATTQVTTLLTGIFMDPALQFYWNNILSLLNAFQKLCSEFYDVTKAEALLFLTGISCINFQFQRSCWKSLGKVTIHHDQWMGMRRSKFVQHVVAPKAPSAPSPAADDPNDLKKLAETYGFQQIGEPLPDDVTLRDIITSLPKKVFEACSISVFPKRKRRATNSMYLSLFRCLTLMTWKHGDRC